MSSSHGRETTTSRGGPTSASDGRGRGLRRGSGGRGGGDYRGGHRGGGDYKGGGGYRGGGAQRGGVRRELPDVRQLAEEMTKLEITKQRPHGKEGLPIELIANHYPIGFDDMSCFHYDIDIRLMRSDGRGYIEMTPRETERKLRNDSKMDNIRVVQKMAKEWPQVFDKKLYAFDGQKNLYCGQKLSVPSEAATREVTIQLDGFQEQRFEVKIQLVGSVSMSPINELFGGRLVNARAEQFREAIQVLEIVIRYMPSQLRVPVFRSLYSTEDRSAIPGNAEIGFGHYQSVQMTESGLTLNIDRAATLFRSAGSLNAFIGRELVVQDLNGVNFTDQVITRINAKIKGLKIFTNHILNQKRRYFIEKMSALTPEKATFKVKDPEGNAVNTTVQKYFKDQYDKEILLSNIPVIIVKGGTVDNPRYLPVELCHVYPDQPVPKRLITPNMTREIVSVANSQFPSQRFGLIQESAQTVEKESSELMASFGINLHLKPTKLKGRVLAAPKLEGNQRRLKSGKSLTKYMFFNLSLAVNPNWRQLFNSFFNELIATGEGMGVGIKKVDAMATPPPHQLKSGPYKSMDTVGSALKMAANNSCQMVFFCVPKHDEIYYAVKYFGDIVYGVPTQCILDTNFMSTPRGYFQNILYKINAKLDGQNQVLSAPQRPDKFTRDVLTMIIGVDVTHPGTNPLANEKVISSIAASVASFDSDFSKYMATIAAQPMNTEIVGNFDQMFVKQLQFFYTKNGRQFPRSVILFRDGVSEGQFSQVIDNEIPLIGKAFRSVGAKEPKITVFVVQKRHHTRLMPLVPKFNDKGREIRNIPAGTVVDHTITNPLNREFHLCSHEGLLGTSRHAKYQCLRDDHKFSEDDKQKLSFYLCHTYCRCTKSISIPTPVMYAHLAAFRAKQHIAAQNIRFEEKVSGESREDKEAREIRNISALNEKIIVNPNLVSLPYYS